VPDSMIGTTSCFFSCWVLVVGNSRAGALGAAVLGSALPLCTSSLAVASVASSPYGWCASSSTGIATCGCDASTSSVVPGGTGCSASLVANDGSYTHGVLVGLGGDAGLLA
jgi:hypothetical protein